jgi:hypothetical protein
MLVDPSLEHGVFGPEATAAMGEAFDAACKELHEVGQLQMVRKVIAQRIIAAARGGELDPVRSELSLKVGDGKNRKGGISWGCLTTPLLH